MGKFIGRITFLASILIALLFGACQEEFGEELTNPDESIEIGSQTAKLIMDTASSDGSFDNIVDGASCISIEFPYNVQIGDTEIQISTADDLQLLEDLFDASDEDDDKLDIDFPITLTLSDYSTVIVENTQQLDALSVECQEGGTDADIECVDFVYPFTIFTFDVSGQRAQTVTVNGDRDLRRFFNLHGEEDLFSIDYPLTLEDYDGTRFEVDSNSDLARVLETAADQCDEDDDNDYNDDDFETNGFGVFLTECPWKINDFRGAGLGTSNQYRGSLLAFGETGTVTLSGPEIDEEGEWTLTNTQEGPLVTLEFDNLADFNQSWLVYAVFDGIQFHAANDHRIRLGRQCGPLEGCDPQMVAESLEGGCVWWLGNNTLGSDFEGYIDFSDRAIQAFFGEDGTLADEGSWETSADGLRFSGLGAALSPIAGDWIVTTCNPNRLKLENGEGQFAWLEKDCETDMDANRLRNSLRECYWVINNIENQGVEVERLLGYELEFTNTEVFLRNGTTTKEGTWEINRFGGDDLALILQIAEEPALNYTWPLQEREDFAVVFERDAEGDVLELYRSCIQDEGNIAVREVGDLLMQGLWNISAFEDATQPDTLDYDEVNLRFSDLNKVLVSENNDTMEMGFWRLLGIRDMPTRLYLNFSGSETLGELTEAWQVGSAANDRVELVYREDGAELKTLTFTRVQ